MQVGANAAIPTGNAVTINAATLNLQNYTESLGAMSLTNGTISGTGHNLTLTADREPRRRHRERQRRHA